MATSTALVAVSKSLNATDTPGLSSKSLAVMERPLRRPIFTTPLFPSAPSVNDAKVWLVPASASEPPGSIVTALDAGNAPVPVSSNTAVSPMRVGPAHACGTVKRKPAPLAAAVLFGLG